MPLTKAAGAAAGADTTTEQLERAARASACADGCGVNLPEAIQHLSERAFAIVIQDFRDPYTLNVKQLMKCCVEEITPDGRLIPFCAYNSVWLPRAGASSDDGRRRGRRCAECDSAATGPGRFASRLQDHARRRGTCVGNRPRPHERRYQGGAPATTPEQIKNCCADAYSSDAAALLLDDSYHPGGAALTRWLAGLLRLRPGQRVADIASGPGATARLLAAEFGVSVDGVDFAAPVVRRAREAAGRAGLTEMVRFHLGDAERVPAPDNTFDAVLSECAFAHSRTKLRLHRNSRGCYDPAARWDSPMSRSPKPGSAEPDSRDEAAHAGRVMPVRVTVHRGRYGSSATRT
jgi:7,8-dihydro-6-hydroxymethylpterin dimethyltransferase